MRGRVHFFTAWPLASAAARSIITSASICPAQPDLAQKFFADDHWPSMYETLGAQLFVKPIVRKLGIGIDTALSDTDTVQMSRVFSSETLRFYNCNTRLSNPPAT